MNDNGSVVSFYSFFYLSYISVFMDIALEQISMLSLFLVISILKIWQSTTDPCILESTFNFQINVFIFKAIYCHTHDTGYNPSLIKKK